MDNTFGYNELLYNMGFPEECSIEFKRQALLQIPSLQISYDAVYIATALSYIGKAINFTKKKDVWQKYGADLNTWEFIALTCRDIELRKLSLIDAMTNNIDDRWENMMKYYRSTVGFKTSYETILKTIHIDKSGNNTLNGIVELTAISKQIFKQKVIRMHNLLTDNLILLDNYRKDK